MTQEKGKTALVIAGGGIMGGAYEIGCLSALDQLFAPGFSSRSFHILVGVSAGSLIATLIANRISPEGLFRAVANREPNVINFRRRDIYHFDLREVFASCRHLAANSFRIYRHYRRNHWGLSRGDLLHLTQEQLPAGLFSLVHMQKYLCRAFRREGVIDDFSLLDGELYIPAYDLDRGQRIVFGTAGYQGLHICQAITASSAIPFFFRPYQIGDRHYIDGSIGRVTHLDIAIERGARLIVVVNPRVPMNNDMEQSCLPSLSGGECSHIADLGIGFTWEQAQRIENKAKLDLALTVLRRDHPEVDIVLIEPGREESLLFFQSPMSNGARHHVMNYGYQLTLSQLRSRYDELAEIFGRHGISTTRQHLHAPPPAEVLA